MMGEHDEFLADFLEECDENLDQLDQELVALEADPLNQDRLRSIFRNVHTIKGSSGFFGFAKLGAVAHEGETLLGKVRDGELQFNQAIASGLLEMADAIREILSQIEQTGAEGERDYSPLTDRLRALLVAVDVSESMADVGESDADVGQAVADLGEPKPEVATPQESEQQVPQKRTAAAGDTEGPDEIAATSSDVVRKYEADGEKAADSSVSSSRPTSEPEAAQRPIDASLAARDDIARPAKTADALSKEATVASNTKPTPLDDNLPELASATDSSAVESGSAKSLESGSIRVDIGLLDELMDFAGELVLARNSLSQCSESVQDPRLAVVASRVSQITSEIQDRVTRTRMQPIGAIWGRFRRVVRDLAVACGKDVRLELEGEETELDRSLLEAIRDPLTHIIRNAVDHGIEPPEVRSARGKSREGFLRLWARHESGQVVIEASDDGAGIDVQRVRDKAIANRLMTAEEAAEATPGQILQCIFEPGFSTAQQVSAISGRGVGMDVVRSHIERIGGSVQLRSVLGQGTTLTIKIPLTLAIVPALTVSAGEQQFVIPQASLMEVVTVGTSSPIEWLHEVPVYRLRGQLLPLVWLDQLLGLAKGNEGSATRSFSPRRQKQHVAVLKVDQLRYGLVIDEVLNSQEIVVKPIGASVKSIGAYSAATILGDGSVALILDIGGIARLSGLVGEDAGRAALTRGSGGVDADLVTKEVALRKSLGEAGRSLLVCQVAVDRQVGIPLEWVERLEELPMMRLQQVDEGIVASYRDGILPIRPLVDVTRPTGSGNRPRDQKVGPTVRVVVCRKHNARVGLLVERVLDIVARKELPPITDSDRAEGSDSDRPPERMTLVNGRVLELVNLDSMLAAAR